MVNPPRTPAVSTPGEVLGSAAARLRSGSSALEAGVLAAAPPDSGGAGSHPPVSQAPAPPLPRVMHQADPAVVLVDLASCEVLHANATAMAMGGAATLRVPVDEWGRQAGLVDLEGSDLALSPRRLSVVVRGESGTGELVRWEPRPRPPDDAVPHGDGPSDQSVPDRAALWVTPFRLGGDPASAVAPTAAVPTQGGSGWDGQQDDVLSRSVLLVLQPVSLPDPFDELNRRVLPDRAVIATHQAFTVSDMRLDDDPLVWVNPAFCRATGYPEHEVLGRNCRFLQGSGTDAAAVGRVRAAVEAHEPVVEVLLNYRKDGTAFWNEVSLSPVLDTDGALVNYVGIQSDVTVRVEADRTHAAALAAEQRARARLALLVDVADAMTELDEDAALRRVTRVLADGLVPWCAVVVANGVLRIPATAGLPDSHIGPPRHLLLPPGDGDDPLGELLRGKATGILEVDCEPTSHPEQSVTRWAMRQLGRREPGRCAVVTIPGRRGVPAVLLVGLPDEIAEPGDQEAVEDRALLAEVVRRIGLSLENARLYAREHLVAETLQRSMLPEQSGVPGLDVWSYYAPSVEHAQVGGDWYDLLQPDDASVGVVIGDVVGHDIEAAAAMGQLRSVVRAYAFEQQEPGEVLMRVDQLVGGMRIQRSASMVYARLTQEDDDGWELSWCRAGHLPPLLVRGSQVETLMQQGGPMVGFETGRRATSYSHLDPGDVLVLYTDGLIERRARPLADGLRLLSDMCADLPPMDAAGIGERLLAALGDEPEDDLAIVIVRVPSAAEPVVASPQEDARSRRWQLPGTPSSVGRARRLAAQTCRLWGLPDTRTTELVVSELVANAVLHGWGTVGVRVQHVDGVLVVEVDDANPAPPLRVEGHRDGPGGFGLNVVDRLCEWGWRPSNGGKTVWARIRP